MRRPGLFTLAFCAATFLTVAPRAQSLGAQDVRYEVLSAEERALIDRIAADFYENDLRETQTRAIEETTALSYVTASEDDRAAFREARRKEWRDMPDAEQSALRDAKQPLYENLTEAQKAPFRRHALNRLGAAGAIDAEALEEALRADI